MKHGQCEKIYLVDWFMPFKGNLLKSIQLFVSFTWKKIQKFTEKKELKLQSCYPNAASLSHGSAQSSINNCVASMSNCTCE